MYYTTVRSKTRRSNVALSVIYSCSIDLLVV